MMTLALFLLRRLKPVACVFGCVSSTTNVQRLCTDACEQCLVYVWRDNSSLASVLSSMLIMFQVQTLVMVFFVQKVVQPEVTCWMIVRSSDARWEPIRTSSWSSCEFLCCSVLTMASSSRSLSTFRRRHLIAARRFSSFFRSRLSSAVTGFLSSEGNELEVEFVSRTLVGSYECSMLGTLANGCDGDEGLSVEVGGENWIGRFASWSWESTWKPLSSAKPVRSKSDDVSPHQIAWILAGRSAVTSTSTVELRRRKFVCVGGIIDANPRIQLAGIIQVRRKVSHLIDKVLWYDGSLDVSPISLVRIDCSWPEKCTGCAVRNVRARFDLHRSKLSWLQRSCNRWHSCRSRVQFFPTSSCSSSKDQPNNDDSFTEWNTTKRNKAVLLSCGEQPEHHKSQLDHF